MVASDIIAFLTRSNLDTYHMAYNGSQFDQYPPAENLSDPVYAMFNPTEGISRNLNSIMFQCSPRLFISTSIEGISMTRPDDDVDETIRQMRSYLESSTCPVARECSIYRDMGQWVVESTDRVIGRQNLNTSGWGHIPFAEALSSLDAILDGFRLRHRYRRYLSSGLRHFRSKVFSELGTMAEIHGSGEASLVINETDSEYGFIHEVNVTQEVRYLGSMLKPEGKTLTGRVRFENINPSCPRIATNVIDRTKEAIIKHEEALKEGIFIPVSLLRYLEQIEKEHEGVWTRLQKTRTLNGVDTESRFQLMHARIFSAVVNANRFEIQMKIGNAYFDGYEITFKASDVPAVYLHAMPGKPATTLIEHPALEGLTITSATTSTDGESVIFGTDQNDERIILPQPYDHIDISNQISQAGQFATQGAPPI
jgi:hypothetical protein